MKNTEVFDALVKICDEKLIFFCLEKSEEIDTVLDTLSCNNNIVVEALKGKSKKLDTEQILTLSKNYQSEKSVHFKEVFSTINMPFFDWKTDELESATDEFICNLPKKKILRQHRDRYYPVEGNSRILKTAKFLKRGFYRIGILPRTMWNGLLHIFGKQTSNIPYRKYRLPLRLLTERFAKTILVKKLDGLISDYAKDLTAVLKSALAKEQQSNQKIMEYCFADPQNSAAAPEKPIDLTPEKKQLAGLKKKLKKELALIYAEQAEAFEKLIATSGTIEQPAFSLRYHNRKSRQRHYKKAIAKTNVGRGNTVFGLFEDWKIDQEIFRLITQIKIELNALEQLFERQRNEISEYLNQSRDKVAKIKERLLKKLSNKNTETAREVYSEIKKLENQLVRSSVNPAVELIIKQNFIGSINEFEMKINAFTAEISDKRWLTKLTDYDLPLKSTDLNSFSPHELLSFKYIPELNETCAEVKAENVRLVESFKTDINNISGIIAFNLSSVIESENFDEKEKDRNIELLAEGFDRALNKIDEIKESLKKYGNRLNGELEDAVKTFIDSTLELTDNENAFALRMTVTKAKAIKRTLDIRLILRDRSKNAFDRAVQKFAELQKYYNDFITPWKRKLGIHGQSAYIATELSDFLSDALHKINKLPIVYQQLYRIQPLTEMNMFTGRKVESEMLRKAYGSWKEGKYAPTVIIGEKWSGHTTLINHFIDAQPESTEVICENRLINISSYNEFLEAWKKILKTETIDSLEALTDLLNTEYKNKIIVLENIQNYYLRTIKGFESIKLFIKLISKTYHNIFWLCTANIYAWQYLNRTIEISGYFGYQIKMSAFTDDELRQLIMKKNNISGYKIIFLPAHKNLENKKFLNLNPDEKQAYLRDQFFKRLNDFAKGNISLALSYWLLSTKNINEGSIEIDYFESPDFSFIGKLNSDKVFIIYVLIMHDGLTLEQLSKVLKQPIDKLHLQVIMLLDDGILVQHDDWFEVNPLIYRHSINMLKMRNLIY